MRLLLIILLLGNIHCFAQEVELVKLAPNERLYRFDMKYTGSESCVDLNYQYLLEELIEYVNKDTTIELHVRGHVCCGSGYKLSRKRAYRAYRYLVKNGIDISRVTYKGYSNTAPLIYPEESPEDEASNRRVDFVIRPRKM